MTTNQNTSNQSVGYKEMMVEAGKQLGLRKKDILKRVIMIIWPTAILSVSLLIGYMYLTDHNEFWNAYQKPLVLATICWAVFSIVYGAIMRTIFSTEKRIWIDSFFDKRPLSTEQSWRIAKKLLMPSVLFRINLFIRYYAIVWVIYFGSLTALILLAMNDINLSWWLFPLILLGFPGVMWVYSHYYLEAHLRFAWFIFIDTYGTPSTNFSKIVSEIDRLNKISTSDSFKRALVAEIGSDSAIVIANTMTGIIQNGVTLINNNAGAIFGGIFKIAAEEMAKQSAHFAKISTTYLLYKKAKELAGDDSQFVNEKVYSLDSM